MDKVTISRHWNNPLISTTVDGDHIALSISVDDFMAAVKEEMGSIAMTFTRDGFSRKLDFAVKAVLGKVKEESTKIV